MLGLECLLYYLFCSTICIYTLHCYRHFITSRYVGSDESFEEEESDASFDEEAEDELEEEGMVCVCMEC